MDNRTFVVQIKIVSKTHSSAKQAENVVLSVSIIPVTFNYRKV